MIFFWVIDHQKIVIDTLFPEHPHLDHFPVKRELVSVTLLEGLVYYLKITAILEVHSLKKEKSLRA